jgi:hypothetical protein
MRMPAAWSSKNQAQVTHPLPQISTKLEAIPSD